MLVDTSGWVEMSSPRDSQPKGGFHEHFLLHWIGYTQEDNILLH
jgi:hypothetical protein